MPLGCLHMWVEDSSQGQKCGLSSQHLGQSWRMCGRRYLHY
jgi:hypothetical protein